MLVQLAVGRRAHARGEVERRGQGLGAVGVAIDVRHQGRGVDTHPARPDGVVERQPQLLEAALHVVELAPAEVQVALVGHLAQAAGEGLHVAARLAAVGVQPLEDDHQRLQRGERLLVVRRDEAAGVAEGVAAGAHVDEVGGLAVAAHQAVERLVRLLPLLPQVGRRGELGGVEHHA